MKTCKSCGAQMEDNQRFCLNCGAESQPAQPNMNYQGNPNFQSPQQQGMYNGNTSFNSNMSAGVNGYQNTAIQPSAPQAKKGISNGAIAAIVIAVVLVVALVVSIPAIVIRSKAEKNPEEAGNSSYSQSESNELSFAYIDGNTYSNDFANLHFDLPSQEWTFLSDEEVTDYFTGYSIDTETGKPIIIDSKTTCYADLVVYDQMTNENILVQIAPSNGLVLSTDAFLDITLDAVEEEYLAQGVIVDDKNSNAGEAEINGNKYSLATINANAYGNEINQLIAVSKIGDCYVSITVTNRDKAYAEDLFYMFY
ncbi:MAG: zinc-ribbon domain-containing protein [Eubacterium sp.]